MKRILAGLVLGFLLVLAAPAAAYHTAYATWQAESFGSLGGNDVVDHYVKYDTSNQIYDTFSSMNAARMVVRAKSFCSTDPAHLVVQINGTTVLNTPVTGSWANYETNSYVANPAASGSTTTAWVSVGASQSDQGACPGGSPPNRQLAVDYVQVFRDWRAFPPSSVWNTTAASKGTITSTAPSSTHWLDDSTDPDVHNTGLFVGGFDKSGHYAKPIYYNTSSADANLGWDFTKFGTPGNDDVTGNFNYPFCTDHGSPVDYCVGPGIPVPSGTWTAAAGSDGHLATVNGDRTVAWEMYGCHAAGDTTESGVPCSNVTVPDGGTWGHFEAATIAEVNLTGTGVGTDGSNSARGSGTSLIPTTLTASEAQYGYHHAIGCSTRTADQDEHFAPATKDDGDVQESSVRYGTLWVLRPDFDLSGYTGAQYNILRALKDYGCYLVDKGFSFEADTDGGSMGSWAGLNVNSPGDLDVVTPADMRCVDTALYDC